MLRDAWATDEETRQRAGRWNGNSEKWGGKLGENIGTERKEARKEGSKLAGFGRIAFFFNVCFFL